MYHHVLQLFQKSKVVQEKKTLPDFLRNSQAVTKLSSRSKNKS